MRIIGGAVGGRRIQAPPGQDTRPTSDRVREALFSILGSPAAASRVLDLYAGAGTLALEALSRGAGRAVLVEQAPPALKCIRTNLALLGLQDRAEVMAIPVARALRRLGAAGAQFEWIFVDAPYASGQSAATLAALGSGALLAADAVVVVEHDRRGELPASNGVLELRDQRVYGDTGLSFYGRVTP
jgi:16S rRNA (guanine966-N2)-methyltransferase